jgi:hypothetical protein
MARDQRLTALTGTAFFVLALVGRLVYPASPDFMDEPSKIASFYLHHDDGVLASNTLSLLGVVCLLGFAGALRAALRREAGDSWLTTTAFGATVAGAALLLAGVAVDGGAALRVQNQHAIASPIAATMWDLNHVLYGVAAPMAFAAAVLATAAIALRTRMLPTWLGAISVVLGIALLVPPINYLALVVFLFWVLAVSLVLATRTTGAEDRAVAVMAPGTTG